MTDRRANYALAVLTFINLFNYVDRWVVATLLEPIKQELGLTDTQLGLIASGFIVVYALTSPIFGTLGDKKKRPPLIAIGVGVWSLATGLAGFARGFVSLFIARSTVGVGEAAYGTIAPALLADQFPYEKRGRVMSIFFAAIPIVLAEVLIFMCTGPVNSAIVNAVSPLERATALGLSVLLMHAFGDIPSPPLIGALSDSSSLERAFLVVPVAVLLSGLIWTYAAWRGERTPDAG